MGQALYTSQFIAQKSRNNAHQMCVELAHQLKLPENTRQMLCADSENSLGFVNFQQNAVQHRRAAPLAAGALPAELAADGNVPWRGPWYDRERFLQRRS